MIYQQKQIRLFEKDQGRSLVDLEELKLNINHAECYKLRDLENRIEKWNHPEQNLGRPPHPTLPCIAHWGSPGKTFMQGLAESLQKTTLSFLKKGIKF